MQKNKQKKTLVQINLLNAATRSKELAASANALAVD